MEDGHHQLSIVGVPLDRVHLITNLYRILELTTGVICGCLPVLVVLFKHLAATDSYARMQHYFIKRNNSSSSEAQDPISDEQKGPGRIQVHITRPAMTALRSFLQKPNRSQAQHGPVESYPDLDSINDDYHAHLNGRARVGR